MVIAGANMFINGAWALNANTAIENNFEGTLLFVSHGLS